MSLKCWSQGMCEVGAGQDPAPCDHSAEALTLLHCHLQTANHPRVGPRQAFEDGLTFASQLRAAKPGVGRAEPSSKQLKTQTASSQGRGASCSRCQTAPTTGMCFHAGPAWKSKNTKRMNFILFTICVWRNRAEEQTPLPSCHSTVAITWHPPKLYFRLRTGRSPGAGTASHLTSASWQLHPSIFTRKL